MGQFNNYGIYLVYVVATISFIIKGLKNDFFEWVVADFYALKEI